MESDWVAVIGIAVGVATGILAAVGAVFAAYHFLSRRVDEKISGQDQRIDNLSTNLDTRVGEISDRLNRELRQRVDKDLEHQRGRDGLAYKIDLLEDKFRRWRERERGE